jgi:hypothetical protein
MLDEGKDSIQEGQKVLLEYLLRLEVDFRLNKAIDQGSVSVLHDLAHKIDHCDSN